MTFEQLLEGRTKKERKMARRRREEARVWREHCQRQAHQRRYVQSVLAFIASLFPEEA